MMIRPVALILPFHSDVDRLRPVLNELAGVKDELGISEVILAHNGGAVPKFDAPEWARLLHTSERGIGAGYRIGIRAASAPWVLLSASDLPFGFTDLQAARAAGESADVFVGSKLHRDSQSEAHGLTRLMLSELFFLWRRFFLGSGQTRDSQGTILLPREKALALLEVAGSKGFFFSLELLFHAHRKGFTVKEVPVAVRPSDGVTAVKPFSHGISLAWQVVVLSFKASLRRSRGWENL